MVVANSQLPLIKEAMAALPEGHRGPCYLVRNRWPPHPSVDDSIEQLLLDPAVDPDLAAADHLVCRRHRNRGGRCLCHQR